MIETAQELAIRLRQLTNELAVTRAEHNRDRLLNNELMSDLDRLQSGLEERIRERTAELLVSNRMLEAEVKERRKTQDELKRAMEKAQAANRAKSEFLANMSHEIRTPMNGVVGMVSLLAETVITDEQRRYLDTIQTSAHYLLTIFNDVLDYSKIEAGKLEILDGVFNPRDVVDGVAGILAPKALCNGVILAATIASDVPDCLHGDSGRIRQVLMNLAGNAVKFTEHGRIDISVEMAKPVGGQAVSGAQNQQPGRAGSGFVHFTVRDTGIGIPAELQGALFEPFTQADSSATRKFGGTGLGLAISRQLVGLMGGQIGLKSPALPSSSGSIFWFTIPVRIEERTSTTDKLNKEITQDEDVQGGSLSGIRVLLVEDNLINRLVATAMLGQTGLEVDVALNGLEALKAVEARPYGLILMDCQMPVMDGYEATRRIREMEDKMRSAAAGTPASQAAVGLSGVQGPHVPIVAMTAHAMKGDREKCLASGMDDYIAKPIERPALLRTISRVIFGASAASQPDRVDTFVQAPERPVVPVFDRKGALARLGGDEELFAQVTTLFAGELGKIVDKLGQTVSRNSASEIMLHAHSLKGSASRIGAMALHEVAQQMEIAARNGETAAVAEQFVNLRQEYQKFMEVFHESKPSDSAVTGG